MKTPLYESHIQLGAKMISFAGWKMPFSYSSPKEEHLNVRKNGGLFDVSHMGEIRIQGKESLEFLEHLVPSDVRSLNPGESQYSVFCNKEGGLIDDLIIYCLKKGQEYFLCVNAGKKDQDKAWLESHKKKFQVDIQDESNQWGMIAIQGPKSLALCKKIFPDVDLDSIQKFHFMFKNGKIFSKTGYTGEEGFEIYIPWKECLSCWEQMIKEGSHFSISAVGFGARDTLRLEMAYLLSGQDFDETCNPLEAGLAWILKNKEDYIGKHSILKKKDQDIQKRLKGFIMDDHSGVPRKGHLLFSDEGEEIGQVTSGASSPSLEKMIGLAYIKEQGKKSCFLDIRGSKVRVQMVSGSILKKEKENE